MNKPILNTANIASWSAGRLVGENVEITSAVIDSRAATKGQLFVALVGEQTDGHSFAQQALDNGASALLVDRELALEVAQVVVDNVESALAEIAKNWLAACREYSGTTVLALTGSCGKTMCKEMLNAVMSQSGSVVATRGNLNNHLGVPLTVLRLTLQHRFLVLEMGASAIGEIAFLSDIGKPDVALVTNAGNAHLAGFGSEQGIANAKGEIYSSLTERGAAIINAESPWAAQWRETAAHTRQYSFALAGAADFTAVPGSISQALGADRCTTRFTMRTPVGEVEIVMPVAGVHNVANALAVAAAAMAAGADLENIRVGLAQNVAVTGRLTVQKIIDGPLRGLHVVDDAYNANPASVMAAIDWLSEVSDHNVLVLGEMAELGPTAHQLHFDIGHYAAEKGIGVLWTLGDEGAAEIAKGYGLGANHRGQFDQLITDLVPALEGADVVLVKGSLSKGTRRVVEALMGIEGTKGIKGI
jgi:UDP-N-acetylmuramoyl-tripeptide--D-alanyl-D-alanine ligase